MAFDVMDYRDLVDLLTQHPEWRSELRSLVLSNELLSLPEEIRALVRAQDRTDIHLGRLCEHVEALSEAQRCTEVRLGELTAAQARTDARLEELAAAQARTDARLEELAEAQARTDSRLEELAAAQARTEARLEELAGQVSALAAAQARTEARLEELAGQVSALVAAQTRTESRLEELSAAQARRMDRVEDRLGELGGQVLEWKYRDRPLAFFSSILKRPRAVPLEELEDVLEERLTQHEFKDVVLLDLLVRGAPRSRPSLPEIWLALEVSVTVDKSDVERSLRRAALLRRAGYKVVPAVAGRKLTEGAQSAAAEGSVVILQNGTCSLWQESVERWVE